jgi:hypothetical protein
MLRVQVNRLRRWEQHREGHTDIPHRAVVLAAMLTTLLSNVRTASPACCSAFSEWPEKGELPGLGEQVAVG